jgi:nitronate monooxygenase
MKQNQLVMWYNTKAAKILGVKYPILQGPFGGNLSTVKLAATVSNMGGLGGYGAYTLTPDEIFKMNEEMRKATDKPYNINLWVSDTDAVTGIATKAEIAKATDLFRPYFEEAGIQLPRKPLPEQAGTSPFSFSSRFAAQMEMILQIRPPVFSFMFGIPSADILAECRKLGIVTIGTATTLDEALALEAAEVDLILASGFEAGGHRPSFLAPSELSITGTFVLTQLIKEKVKTPVITAGGIATGAGIAAAMTLGADAVQIGTAFLACEESNAPEIHREKLFSDAAKYTVLTRAFTGRLGRGLRSRISEETRGKEESYLPFPLQSQFMSSLRQAALAQKKWDLILFWGGQIAPILKHRKAEDLMNALINYF